MSQQAVFKPPTRSISAFALQISALWGLYRIVPKGIVWLIDWGIDCFCRKPNEDVEKAGTIAPSVSERIASLEEGVGDLRRQVDKLNAIVSNMSLPEVA